MLLCVVRCLCCLRDVAYCALFARCRLALSVVFRLQLVVCCLLLFIVWCLSRAVMCLSLGRVPCVLSFCIG